MAFIILLIVIGLPILELSVLIEVGGEVGALSTVFLCLLTAAIGLSLVRLQGLAVMARMQEASARGEPVGDSLVHGFFLLIAGFFLLIPGFITDAAGALLLIPPVRLLLGRAGLARMFVRKSSTQTKTTIIEGEFYETRSGESPETISKNHDRTQ